MKKVKIISLLLVLAMAVSLCACSSEEVTEQKKAFNLVYLDITVYF